MTTHATRRNILKGTLAAAGQVDGYMPKLQGLAIMPLALVMVFAVFSAIPVIDPLKANIARFERYYAGFVVAVMAYLAYLYGLTLAWNLGLSFALVPALVPAMAALIFLASALPAAAHKFVVTAERFPDIFAVREVLRAHPRGLCAFAMGAPVLQLSVAGS